MTTMPAPRWSADWINALPPSRRRSLLRGLTSDESRLLSGTWSFWAHDAQRAPPGDWRIWLFLGGRGAGKTRAGAEWVADAVRHGRMRRVGLIGATFADVRAVMVEGESGLLAASDGAAFQPSNKRVIWPSGAVATLISADEPDIVRGHQFDGAWADEFAKWSKPQAALDMLLMALRIGKDPRLLVTTTPRAIPALKALIAAPGTVETRARTRSNADGLSSTFLADVELRYRGTRLGRQELDAELIEDCDAALWRRDWIERGRVRAAPELVRVTVAVDPPVSVSGDECGIVVAGLAEDGDAYVIGDWSATGLTAAGWAGRVAEAYDAAEADAIVAEANQGGDMVKRVLLDALPNVAVRLVHATRDKRTRAAPAAMLYEQGRVHHAGVFPELEDQLCQYDGTGSSPDRMDALVWALTDLFPLRRAKPRIRTL